MTLDLYQDFGKGGKEEDTLVIEMVCDADYCLVEGDDWDFLHPGSGRRLRQMFYVGVKEDKPMRPT